MIRPVHPLFARIARAAAAGPLVVAHRGDSRLAPENTLAAFRAALAVGAPMLEFDVRATRDGVLVCVHDASLDRTTDAAVRLGPGALVAHHTLAELLPLAAGARPGQPAGGTRIPTLAEALATMVPRTIPLIEHKAGTAEAYVQELRRSGGLGDCILQSFDWAFVAAAHALEPALALAVLGPCPGHAHLDDAAVAAAMAAGAGMVHWDADELTSEAVSRCRAAGLLVCTYTTDDEPGQRGLAAMGVDALCTNDPGSALERQRRGWLARGTP